jgi:hypothetical protein
VEALQDDQLFVLDTEPSQSVLGKIAKRRKKEAKPLRSQLVLEAIGQGIQAVNPGASKHKTRGALPRPQQQAAEHLSAAAPAKQRGKQRGKQQQQRQAALGDVWQAPSAAPVDQMQDFLPEMRSTAYKTSLRKHRSAHVSAAPLIKAVEVDPGGCSFNPDVEQHQDAVALLVEQEMRKVLRQELAPKAPPLEADADYKRLSELEQLPVDTEADDGGCADPCAAPHRTLTP